MSKSVLSLHQQLAVDPGVLEGSEVSRASQRKPLAVSPEVLEDSEVSRASQIFFILYGIAGPTIGFNKGHNKAKYWRDPTA